MKTIYKIIEVEPMSCERQFKAIVLEDESEYFMISISTLMDGNTDIILTHHWQSMMGNWHGGRNSIAYNSVAELVDKRPEFSNLVFNN